MPGPGSPELIYCDLEAMCNWLKSRFRLDRCADHRVSACRGECGSRFLFIYLFIYLLLFFYGCRLWLVHYEPKSTSGRFSGKFLCSNVLLLNVIYK